MELKACLAACQGWNGDRDAHAEQGCVVVAMRGMRDEWRDGWKDAPKTGLCE